MISANNKSTCKLIIGLFCLLVLTITGCKAKTQEASDGKEVKGAAKGAQRPAPVTAAVAVQKNIPIEIKAVGNIESYATVSIKARVNGELQKVHFAEGQEVSKGKLLFTIDPRPFQAALNESSARLEKDKALFSKAEDDYRRYENLLQRGSISREQFDQVRANLSALKATIQADEAVVENARVQLGYTSIYSPISGRTGNLLIDQGNMIKANDDNKSLVVIEQIRPIYVGFAVPEANLYEIMKRLNMERLSITALPEGSKAAPVKGLLSFVDNSVDSKTGTIRLKGTFKNQDGRLWPGQFVNVVLTLGDRKDVVMVPSQAVQNGANGPYVFTITQDNKVEYKPIMAGRTHNGETVIEKGVLSGEKIVTDGHLRLTPGAPVEITDGVKPGNNNIKAGNKEVRP
ncbi:MAG: efflux RND transporter periplasmic adaptor subunit [Desulfobacteraceae bacterium]|nr:MAG: efflux RND transporter periplasmic adaptor subunit [Desulfobacteraceae bacterium]